MGAKIRKIREGLNMEGAAAGTVQVPNALQPGPTDPPEVIEVSKTSFKLNGGKIIVTLKTNGEKPVQFAIGCDKFLTGITAAVAFMNAHLCQFFDLIGGP